MKRSLSLLLTFILLFTIATPLASAEGIAPRFTHISSLYRSLSIDESSCVATCQGSVTASGYYPVKVVCEIQIYQGGRWVTLKTWTDSGNVAAAVHETYTLSYGNDYRVYVTGYVYDSNGNLLESASGSHAQYLPWPLRSID